jgi:hypothetical protein
VTDPLDPPADPAARRGGIVAGALGVAALAVAVVVFLAGGGVLLGGAVLLVGLGAALTASVLLWIAWTDEDAGWTPRRSGRGLAATTLALLLTCACVVVALGRLASSGVQLALISGTAVVLAVAVLLARPPADGGRSAR